MVFGFWLILAGAWALMVRDRHRLEAEVRQMAAASMAATLQAQPDRRSGLTPPAAMAARLLQSHARSMALDTAAIELTVVDAMDGRILASTGNRRGAPRLSCTTPVAGTSWRLGVRVQRDGSTGLLFGLLGLVGLAFTLLAARLTLAHQGRLQERRNLRAQLRRAECQEQRAIRTQQRFFSAASHELRTPLNALLGFSELLQLAPDGPQTGRFARLVHDSGQQLLRLVNGLLDLAMIDAGRLPIERRRVHATELVLDAMQRHRPAAQAKGLCLQASVPDDGPLWLDTDAARFVQILDELLGNAVKFTAQGWIRLDCAVEGECLAVTLTDTGCGIPQERLDAVFERFASADAQQHAGSGLGLPLSLELARLLGGGLDLGSAVGQGTRVCLRLPLSGRLSPAAGTTAPTAGRPRWPAAPPPGPGRR